MGIEHDQPDIRCGNYPYPPFHCRIVLWTRILFRWEGYIPMTHDDWIRIVAHLRTEIVRYFPNCPPHDVSVNVLPSCGIELILTPDEGQTEIRLVQTNHDDSDAEWFSFRTPTRRIVTVPFA
jgi:hypothetical protein